MSNQLREILEDVIVKCGGITENPIDTLEKDNIDQAEQAIKQWVREIIGEDEDKFADVPDYAMMKPVYHIRNKLRSEMRDRLDGMER